MINKNCPLGGKKKFCVVMDGECSDWASYLRENSPCKGCSFFAKILTPIVRRAIPRLIANDILGVQPMVAPDTAFMKRKFTFKYKGKTKIKEGNPNDS